MNIMNQDYYNHLCEEWDGVEVSELHKPTKGVPLSYQEYDYKTYYVQRMNSYHNKLADEASVGKVYLVADGKTLVKIGITRNMPSRLQSLKTASGRELTLVATYTPTKIEYSALEKLLHKHYKDYRTLGEWFRTDISKEEFLSFCKAMDT